MKFKPGDVLTGRLQKELTLRDVLLVLACNEMSYSCLVLKKDPTEQGYLDIVLGKICELHSMGLEVLFKNINQEL